MKRKKLFVERIDIDKENYQRYEISSENQLNKYYREHKGIKLIKNTSHSKLLKKYGVKFEAGIPDFCHEQNNELLFVEAKSETDGLSYSQIKWICENAEFDVTISFIHIHWDPVCYNEQKKGVDTKWKSIIK